MGAVCAVAAAGVALGCVARSEDAEELTSVEEQPIAGGAISSTNPLGVVRVTGGGVCTGTAVTPTWMITAKHCTDGVDLADFRVTAGWTKQRVTFVQPHSSLDVSLLRLDGPIDRTATSKQVSLHNALLTVPASSMSRKPATCWGWGRSGYQVDDAGDNLRVGSTTFGTIDDDDDNLISVFGQPFGQSPYIGDSGGPCYFTSANAPGYPMIGGITKGGPDRPTSADLTNGAKIQNWVDWWLFSDPFALDGAFPVASGPALARGQGGSDLEIFVTGPRGVVYESVGRPGAYSEWASVGGRAVGDPGATTSFSSNPEPAKVHLFVRWNDDTLRYRRKQYGWGAAGWVSLGGVLNSSPAAAASNANTVFVFARGSDNAMWYRRLDGETWRDWESLGGVFTSAPAAVSSLSGFVHVFGRGTNNSYYFKYFDGNAWTANWQSIGGTFTSAPAVASSAPGRVDVFGLGTNGMLYHRKWWGAWQPTWNRITNVAMDTDPDAISLGTGKLDVMVGKTGAIQQITYPW